jgi:hypothetical protein
MSDHRLDVDVQKIAIALQAIRAQINILEQMIQEALIKENNNE